MKIDCGRTWGERRDERAARGKEWRRVFAWLPVRVGYRDCRWLETVEMREEFYEFIDGGGGWDREWRAAQ